MIAAAPEVSFRGVPKSSSDRQLVTNPNQPRKPEWSLQD
jgi:hypothetical protein